MAAGPVAVDIVAASATTAAVVVALWTSQRVLRLARRSLQVEGRRQAALDISRWLQAAEVGILAWHDPDNWRIPEGCARLLGVERAVVEDIGVEQQAIVVSLCPKSREKHRCGVCGRRCPHEDCGEGRRRWRARDLGTTFAYLEADAPRMRCRPPRTGGGRGAVGAA